MKALITLFISAMLFSFNAYSQDDEDYIYCFGQNLGEAIYFSAIFQGDFSSERSDINSSWYNYLTVRRGVEVRRDATNCRSEETRSEAEDAINSFARMRRLDDWDVTFTDWTN